MLALSSVWLGLLTFLIALGMLLFRPIMTDLSVTAVLWFGSPGAMCLGGLVLWAYRKDRTGDPGVAAQRIQAKVAIALAIVAAGIVYALIIGSTKFEPIEPAG
jgi:hypothetical protein